MNKTLTFAVLLNKQKTSKVYNEKYFYAVDVVSSGDAISVLLNRILDLLL